MEGWHILESLAVRTTGFPIELLERLRTERTTAIIRAVLVCDQDIEQQRRLLLDEQFRNAVAHAHDVPQGQQILRQLSSWRRLVGNERFVAGLETLPSAFSSLFASLNRWNDLLQKREALYEEGHRIWHMETLDASRAMRELAADTRIQEAIFLSNPDMYTALHRYLTDDANPVDARAAKKFERRFFLYLQRFCAKNETQSFFGPINYGSLCTDQPENVRIHRVATPLRQRTTFPGQWLAEALATKISAEPELRPFLRPRRGTVCVLHDNALFFPATGKRISLEAQTARLFMLADGRHTIEKLLMLLEESWSDIWKRINDLHRLGALTSEILVPPDSADPLLYLMQWLQEVPDNLPRCRFWKKVVHDLSTLIAAIAAANLDERRALVERLELLFTEAVGDAARRGAGRMYTDRLLFFEECLGDLDEYSFGGTLAQHVTQRLQPILNLAHHYAQLCAERDVTMARRVLDRFVPSESGVPLLSYLHSLATDQPETLARDTEALDLFFKKIREVVLAHSDGHVARLGEADLPIDGTVKSGENYLCTSLDLMIAAPSQESLAEGTFQLVLGEMHPYPLLWVFPTDYFARSHNTPWQQALAQDLSYQPDSPRAAQLGFTRKTKIFPYPLPGPTIELRPRYPTCEAIPVAAVTIRDGDGGPFLYAQNEQLRLYTPITRRAEGLDPIAPFSFPAVEAPPIRLGAHTPRIEINGVVYQRERWEVEGGSLCNGTKKGFDLFLEVWRWKERLGLPDEVFVRAEQEPKPFFIDFTCFFSAEALDSIARQSKQMIITEMWPDTRHLWLEGPEGRHTCECRLVVMAHAQPGGAL